MNAFSPFPLVQLDLWTAMSVRCCDAMRRMAELQAQLAHQLMTDAAETARRLLSVGDPSALAGAAESGAAAIERYRGFQQKLLGVVAGLLVDVKRDLERAAPDSTRALADEVVRRSAEAGPAHPELEQQEAS